MSQEDLNLSTDLPAEQINTEVEVSTEPSVEDRARADGWVAKEDYKGDPAKWVDAGEFIRRGELFAKIEAQSKELKSIKQTMKEFSDFHAKVQETAYKDALNQLKRERVAALEAGDVQEFTAIEDKIEELKETRQTEATKAKETTAAGPSPVFLEFHASNPWYLKDRDLTQFADAIGASYFQEGHTEAETLAHVAREVRKRFPEKFTKVTPPTNSVASGKQIPATKTSADKVWDSLTAEEKRVADRFIRGGFISKEQYIKEYMQINQAKAR